MNKELGVCYPMYIEKKKNSCYNSSRRDYGMNFFNGMPAQDFESNNVIYAKIASLGQYFCEILLLI